MKELANQPTLPKNVRRLQLQPEQHEEKTH